MRVTISTSIILCSVFLTCSCMIGDADADPFTVPRGLQVSYRHSPDEEALKANPEAGTVEENGRYVRLSWLDTADTDYTAVWRSPDGKNEWFCLSWGNTGSYYNDYQVEPGDVWFYRVQAVPSNYSNREPSPCTGPVEAAVPHDEHNTLAVPRNFAAISDPGSSGSVQLSWDEVSGAEGYRIYRRSDAEEPWMPALGIGVAGATEYVDAGLPQGLNWEYRISAHTATEHSLQAKTRAQTRLSGYTTAASAFPYSFDQNNSRTETFFLDNTLNSLFVSCPVSGLSSINATWTALDGEGALTYEVWAVSDTGTHERIAAGGVTAGETTAIAVETGVQSLVIRTEARMYSGFSTMLYSLKLSRKPS